MPPWSIFLLFASLLIGARTGKSAEENYEKNPIRYSDTLPQDAITRLEARMAAGNFAWAGSERDKVHALLQELQVPVASQLLVFSRTSMQRSRISAETPRAIYFSDSCYVGWVPGGVIEITTIDPQLGPVFYSIDPRNRARQRELKFDRDRDCLRCHGGHFVRGIPGIFARSVFPDETGEPIFKLGSTLVDYRTPFEERWGGWYVTGHHGAATHRGNVWAREENDQLIFPVEQGANISDLASFIDTSRYLRPSSDIVALLVFEHQIAVQNAITQASHDACRMLHYQDELQQAFDEPRTEVPSYDSVKSVFASATRLVVDALLSKDEAPLPSGLKGNAEFRFVYENAGRYSREGFSLNELSLRGRLYRHRCSPLIHSDMFLHMPDALKQDIYTALDRALDPDHPGARYDYIKQFERLRLRTILAETHDELRAHWSQNG